MLEIPLVTSIESLQSQMKQLKDLVSISLDQSQNLLKISTDFKDFSAEATQHTLSSAFSSPLVRQDSFLGSSPMDELAAFKKVGTLATLADFKQSLQKV